MNEFLKVLLSLSVSGTLLLLLILGLKPVYQNKFSRRWQYYIWIIVVLRFLLPFSPDTTLVGSLFERFDTADVTTAEENSGSPANPAVTKTNTNPINKSTDNISETNQMQVPSQTPAPMRAHAINNIDIVTAHNSLNVSVCLFFLWAVPALVLFVRNITLYQGYIRYIKAYSTEVSNIKTLNQLSDCKEKLHIKTRVELYHNMLLTSPIMIGFFHPDIILPDGKLKNNELSYIFMHELLHYKQRDMFYKWLIQIATCIHWFNPFVYLLEKEVNKACELSCDEAVISVLENNARREYGDMLISFVKSNHSHKNALASVTLTEGAEQIKERLGAIMNFKRKTKTISIITTIFTIAICFCFLAVGAYAAPSSNNNTQTWKDTEIINNVLTEDGVYYIFCDGADENDKPLSSVSAGSIKFVLVRKDGYTSIGPFNNPKTLVNDVTKQCNDMKTLTQEEKELVIKTAKNIETGKNSAIFIAEAAQYYESGSLPMFQIAFSNLDEEAQSAWLDKIYADGKVAFFSVSICELNADSPLIETFAEKSYEDDDIGYFSVLSGNMTEETLESWLEKAVKDQKTDFQLILFGALGMNDELDAYEKEWEEKRLKEYQSFGVTKKGKNYYYEDQLVNIFLDKRPDSSFYTLNINPKGTVNIQVVRNTDGEITGVFYMTEEEAARLLGEVRD